MSSLSPGLIGAAVVGRGLAGVGAGVGAGGRTGGGFCLQLPVTSPQEKEQLEINNGIRSMFYFVCNNLAINGMLTLHESEQN